MNIDSLSTPLAACVAGMAASLHCAGMCGPLVCAVRARPVRYHGSRIAAYSIIGGMLGGFGWAVNELLDSQVAHVVPWILAATLMVIGFGVDRWIPQPKFLSRLLIRVRLSRTLGWVTPLLPCGPLWMMYGVAIFAGSAWKGAMLLGSFALGTVPLYWILQAGVMKLQSGQRWVPGLQRLLALCAATLLVWRTMVPGHDCCQ